MTDKIDAAETANALLERAEGMRGAPALVFPALAEGVLLDVVEGCDVCMLRVVAADCRYYGPQPLAGAVANWLLAQAAMADALRTGLDLARSHRARSSAAERLCRVLRHRPR